MGLKEKGGGLQNGTMDEEYFATSVKPRRKHPKEVRLKYSDIKCFRFFTGLVK